jgi:hypothetical protein
LLSQVEANSPGSTRADANNTERAAGQANWNVGTDDGTQEAEEGSDHWVRGGLDAVAALDRADELEGSLEAATTYQQVR